MLEKIITLLGSNSIKSRRLGLHIYKQYFLDLPEYKEPDNEVVLLLLCSGDKELYTWGRILFIETGLGVGFYKDLGYWKCLGSRWHPVQPNPHSSLDASRLRQSNLKAVAVVCSYCGGDHKQICLIVGKQGKTIKPVITRHPWTIKNTSANKLVSVMPYNSSIIASMHNAFGKEQAEDTWFNNSQRFRLHFAGAYDIYFGIEKYL